MAASGRASPANGWAVQGACEEPLRQQRESAAFSRTPTPSPPRRRNPATPRTPQLPLPQGTSAIQRGDSGDDAATLEACAVAAALSAAAACSACSAACSAAAAAASAAASRSPSPRRGVNAASPSQIGATTMLPQVPLPPTWTAPFGLGGSTDEGGRGRTGPEFMEPVAQNSSQRGRSEPPCKAREASSPQTALDGAHRRNPSVHERHQVREVQAWPFGALQAVPSATWSLSQAPQNPKEGRRMPEAVLAAQDAIDDVQRVIDRIASRGAKMSRERSEPAEMRRSAPRRSIECDELAAAPGSAFVEARGSTAKVEGVASPLNRRMSSGLRSDRGISDGEHYSVGQDHRMSRGPPMELGSVASEPCAVGPNDIEAEARRHSRMQAEMEESEGCWYYAPALSNAHEDAPSAHGTLREVEMDRQRRESLRQDVNAAENFEAAVPVVSPYGRRQTFTGPTREFVQAESSRHKRATIGSLQGAGLASGNVSACARQVQVDLQPAAENVVQPQYVVSNDFERRQSMAETMGSTQPPEYEEYIEIQGQLPTSNEYRRQSMEQSASQSFARDSTSRRSNAEPWETNSVQSAADSFRSEPVHQPKSRQSLQAVPHLMEPVAMPDGQMRSKRCTIASYEPTGMEAANCQQRYMHNSPDRGSCDMSAEAGVGLARGRRQTVAECSRSNVSSDQGQARVSNACDPSAEHYELECRRQRASTAYGVPEAESVYVTRDGVTEMLVERDHEHLGQVQPRQSLEATSPAQLERMTPDGHVQNKRGTLVSYELIGAEPGEDARRVKQHFREAVLQSHPDRGGNHERFIEVQNAMDHIASKRQSVALVTGRSSGVRQSQDGAFYSTELCDGSDRPASSHFAQAPGRPALQNSDNCATEPQALRQDATRQSRTHIGCPQEYDAMSNPMNHDRYYMDQLPARGSIASPSDGYVEYPENDAGRMPRSQRASVVSEADKRERYMEPPSYAMVNSYEDVARQDVAAENYGNSGRPIRTQRRTTVESYELIGAAPGASAAEVRQCYRGAVLQNHPDRGGRKEDLSMCRMLQIISLRKGSPLLWRLAEPQLHGAETKAHGESLSWSLSSRSLPSTNEDPWHIQKVQVLVEMWSPSLQRAEASPARWTQPLTAAASEVQVCRSRHRALWLFHLPQWSRARQQEPIVAQ
eukprot:TRINITY_DN56895_c0_g1_i1.p1 TRINITY_DN56895_c0_g1~~TRINITY_DN56895_c0_g1_i1.p1  ORF type:complete len:1240 (-),score=139.08 TRINITY_DN56895_c0_g1_i1:1302-4787(-)